MAKRKKKSKSYQYKIVEVPFDQTNLNNFSSDRGIGHILENSGPSEEMVELKRQLVDELYKIIFSEQLTEHQKKIIFMRLEGQTQNQIAEHLGITQSAVHKAIHGNIDYRNNKKRYGGIIKKIQKLSKNNERIQEILRKMQEFRDRDREDDEDLFPGYYY